MMINVEVSISAIIDALIEQDHDEIKRIIVDLDRVVADYDFTKGLRDYFVEEMRKEDSFKDEE
jgi:hypothetical protein